MDTKRLEEHDQRLTNSMHRIGHAIRAIWLELASSGMINEETVLHLHHILAITRAHLDALQRDIEVAAGFHSERSILDLVSHFTFHEKFALLQALYEEWDDLYMAAYEDVSQEATSKSN